MSERWLPVVGINRYEVSDRGRIRSLVKPGEPKVMRQITNRAGYQCVTLAVGTGRQRMFFVHVLVLEAFGRARPEGMETRHLNGRAADNDLSNLRWGTPLENATDKHRHGTMSRKGQRPGEDHPAARLNETIVRQIRILRSNGRSYESIAREIGFNVGTVWSAATGRTWKHVS